MAYISQYEADMRQDAKNNEIYKGVGGIIDAFQENRQRALATKKAQEAQNLQYAANGATPDLIEQANQGDLSGIQNLYAENAAFKKSLDQAKNQREISDSQLDRDYKKSQIFKNYQEGKNSGEKMSEKEKIDYRHKLEQDTKQPAQNEFAAAGYAKRARMAEQDFGKLPRDTGTSTWAAFKDYVPNAIVSENLQLADQAKRNFISANLRKESGAAISDSEYQNEDKKYFPQPGDSEAVITQKARAREQAMLNLEAEGSRALPRVSTATPAAPPQIQQKLQQMTPEQKMQRLQQLKAKQAGVAMGGQ